MREHGGHGSGRRPPVPGPNWSGRRPGATGTNGHAHHPSPGLPFDADMLDEDGPLDLVELQLRVAAGAPLQIGQDDVTVNGHAIEARVYAEDSFNGFLPQAGRATHVEWPRGLGIRVDHALESGQVVSTAYDPMLGKVIASGATKVRSVITTSEPGPRAH